MWILVTVNDTTMRINVAQIVRYWPATAGTAIRLVGDDLPLFVEDKATEIDRMIEEEVTT